MDIDLSGAGEHCNYTSIPPLTLPCIHLSSDYSPPPDPLAFKHFKFQGLKVVNSVPRSPQFLEYCRTHLRVLDLYADDRILPSQYHSVKQGLFLTALVVGADAGNLRMLFKACHVLEEFRFDFSSGIGWALSLIPSNFVALIRLLRPLGVFEFVEGVTPTAVVSCTESWLDLLKREAIPEYERLGVSIQEVAQRFSKHNHGLKTRVQVIYQPSEKEVQGFESGEIPLFMTKLEEELGTHVALELKLLPFTPISEWWKDREKSNLA